LTKQGSVRCYAQELAALQIWRYFDEFSYIFPVSTALREPLWPAVGQGLAEVLKGLDKLGEIDRIKVGPVVFSSEELATAGTTGSL
jgi:hypothetical protein